MDWQQFDRGIFLVNVLAIIYNPQTKKVLIGKRRDDPYIPELSWSFPGGRPAYKEDLEFYLKFEIKRKTGVEVRIKELIHARLHPEMKEFLSMYYLCEPLGGKEQAGEKFSEIKWVFPHELKYFFTTKMDSKVEKFLSELK